LTLFHTGSKYIHLLTSGSPGRLYTLRIDLADFDNQTRFAEYTHFTVASAADHFTLSVGDYSGDAGLCIYTVLIKNKIQDSEEQLWHVVSISNKVTLRGVSTCSERSGKLIGVA